MTAGANKISIGNLRGLIDPGFDKPDFREFLRDPDRAFVDADELLKDSPTTTAAFVTAEVGGEPREFHLKRINNKGISFTVGNLAKSSRAVRNFLNAKKLIEMGIPTPRPVAALDERKFRALKKSYYITERVGESAQLYEWLKENFRSLPQPERSKLAEELAAFVRKMHFAGVLHGDLKCSNVLLLPGERLPRFLITDLDAVTFSKKGWRQQAAAIEMARLSLSAYDTVEQDDRTHFLAAYFNAKCGSEGWGETGEFIKLVAAAMRKHLAGQKKKKKYPGEYFEYFESGAGRCPRG